MDWTTHFLSKIKDFHLLVVGDIMLDRYLWGTVDRISPEAPVPILHLRESENRPGGAANVAMNIAGLGARVSIFGCSGDDERGALLTSLLSSANVNTSWIQHLDYWQTTTKTRVIGGHQHLLRVDEERPLDLEPGQAHLVREAIELCIEKTNPDAVVVQDYNKGLLSKAFISSLLDAAGDIPVMVDPKDDHFFAYRGVTIFKPNLRELAAKVPFRVDISPDSLQRASDHIREKLQHDISCFTLSEHGVFIDDGSAGEIVPTNPRRVVDVCGAGDGVLSVLALGYLAGLDKGQLAHVANTAGGIICEEVGVSPVQLGRLTEELTVKTFS